MVKASTFVCLMGVVLGCSGVEAGGPNKMFRSPDSPPTQHHIVDMNIEHPEQLHETQAIKIDDEAKDEVQVAEFTSEGEMVFPTPFPKMKFTSEGEMVFLTRREPKDEEGADEFAGSGYEPNAMEEAA